MNKLLFLLMIFSMKSFAQSDAITALTGCGSTKFNGLTVSGAGVQEIFFPAACIIATSPGESNSIWIKLSFVTSGTFSFLITPVSPDINEDFDFYIFGPNVVPGNLGSSIRCSTTNPALAGAADNLTGLNVTETDVQEGPGPDGNSYVKNIDVLAGETYFLMIDRPIGSSDFDLEFSGTAQLPTAATIGNPNVTIPIILDQKVCDNDGVLDGSTKFNIDRNLDIIGSQINVSVKYYLTENAAIIGATGDPDEILDPLNFENVINPQQIFVRATNNLTKCFATGKFSLEVFDHIDFVKNEFKICDDGIDGNETNGKAIFDLSKVTDEVFNNVLPTGITFSYFLNQSDANLGINPLSNLFYNTVPNLQNIVLKATTTDGCNFYQTVKLIVKQLPIKISETLSQCDSDVVSDGLSLFRLNKADNSFLQNNPKLSVIYYLDNTQLQANNQLPNAYANVTNPQNIIAQITDSDTNCSSSSTLILQVNTIPNFVIAPLSICDNAILENGLNKFDLSKANVSLTSTQTLKYYLTANDALLEQNEITTSTTNYSNVTAYNDTVFVRIQDNNNCSTISELKLIVDKLPNLEILRNEKDFICTNLPNKFINIDAGLLAGSINDYSYNWFLNGIAIAPITHSISINKEGKYTVDVTNKNSLCFKTSTTIVRSSVIASFGNIIINDLTDKNSVTINVSGIGGQYEFSLDEPNGPFQTSNYFDNVEIGFHDVYVNDANGCGVAKKSISVLGAPKYFTPNSDGINDYWNIKGINTTEYLNSTILIFDRFGKLLKQIAPNSLGWDGKSNNYLLPADDYWYILQLENGRSAKGNFSLKR